jgi:CRISPR system Cascade subunit CasC
VRLALAGLALQLDEEGKSQYLFFLGKGEQQSMAQAIKEYWNDLLELAEKEDRGQKKKEKKLVSKELKDLVQKLKAALDGGKAIDLALFGRMLADLPEKNVDAACQVAHAISIHRVEKDFDYYTAVDDLTPEDTSGAGMIGTVEFNSACFYRYLNVNVEKLLKNLQGDWELAQAGLKAFLQAVVESMPTGKQNSFAAYNPPEFVAVAVRSGAPRNLAGTFEKPIHVKMSDDKSLTAKGVEALGKKYATYSQAYGDGGKLFVLDLTGSWDIAEGKRVDSLDKLLEETIKEVNAVANMGG